MMETRICRYFNGRCHEKESQGSIEHMYVDEDWSGPSIPVSKAHRHTRICRYFGSKCHHGKSFLSLPTPIRQRIYSFAGLYEGRRINFVSFSYFSTPEDNLIKDLLLVCRAVYHDVASILFSTNYFAIQNNWECKFAQLRRTSPSALAYIRHLEVLVNQADMYYPYECVGHYPPHWKQEDFQTSELLMASSRPHQSLLDEWNFTAEYAFRHMKLSEVTLSFQCETDDIEVAMKAVGSLRKRQFRSCNILLNLGKTPELNDLARKLGMDAIGIVDRNLSTSPFRFMDLPKELRTEILERTDLVTPNLEVEWTKTKGFFLQCARDGWCQGEECPPDFHHSCRFRNCAQRRRTKCYCMLFHSSYTPMCHCWSSPESMFLVSRQFRDECHAVFFRRNTFVITPCYEDDELLCASIFLRKVIPFTALRYLKFLEIVFPRFILEKFGSDGALVRDWRRTIEDTVDKSHLPNLTLSLYFPDHMAPTYGGFNPGMSVAERWTYFGICSSLAQPFTQWKNLKRVFANIDVPFPGIYSYYNYWIDVEFDQEYRWGIELWIEWTIMGKDYDAWRAGKYEYRQSQWIQTCMEYSWWEGRQLNHY